MRPDNDMIEIMARIVRQYPQFLEFVDRWKQQELDQLPAVHENTALAQGRCLLLQEMHKHLKDAPDITAKRNSPLAANKHTA